MSSIKRFFLTIWSAATKPSAYLKFKKKTTSEAGTYLYLLLLLIWVITLVPFFFTSFAAFPGISTAIGEFKTEAPNLYPAELVLTFKDSQLSTNVREPYYIELPPRWKEFIDTNHEAVEEMTFEHLVAIDTNGNPENFAQYRSFVLLTKNSFAMPDQNDAIKLMPYGEIDDTVINAPFVKSIIARVLPFADFVLPALLTFWILLAITLPFIVAAFVSLWYLVYVLVMALVLWVLSMIMQRKTTYGELYRLSLYGLTLPLAYGLIVSFFDMTVPFLFTLIFLVWMGVVIAKFPKKKA